MPDASIDACLQAIQHMEEGLCVFDRDARLVICNQRYIDLYELPASLARPGALHADINAWRFSHGCKSSGTVEDFMNQHMILRRKAGGRGNLIETRNGTLVAIHHRELPLGGWVATHIDVTEDLKRVITLEENERDLQRKNFWFAAAVDNMGQGLCMFSADGHLVICNRIFADMFGLPERLTRPGTAIADIQSFDTSDTIATPDADERFAKWYGSRQTQLKTLILERRRNGGQIVEAKYHLMSDGGFVATYEDVTEARQQQQRVRHLSEHDALTGLPNRNRFSDELEKLKRRIQAGEKWGFFYLDVDNFKKINDDLGHTTGDTFLKHFAARLSEACKSRIIARLGGDEFGVLLGPLRNAAEAFVAAQRIISVMAVPFDIGGHEVHGGVSIGIALTPNGGLDGASLMRNADLALNEAKAKGRASFQRYDSSLRRSLESRQFLEHGIRKAMERQEFSLVFQPIVGMRDVSVVSLEALLRWHHPERGQISPAEFIPIAEEIGAMGPIGQWVLQQACKTAAQWPDPIKVAVNVSAVQFRDQKLVEQVLSALDGARLSASRLELEITETLLLEDTDAAQKVLSELRDNGVRIAIDDFGKGYSSLSYLCQIPLDKIKIDQSFIRDINTKPVSKAVFEAVIGLSHTLGAATTAEGVENEEQFTLVKELGCTEAQGYYLSKPLTAADAKKLLGNTVRSSEGTSAKSLHKILPRQDRA